ncbi:MAG: hypothetical protein AAF242_07930, partial [Bacteroidota bacterium]
CRRSDFSGPQSLSCPSGNNGNSSNLIYTSNVNIGNSDITGDELGTCNGCIGTRISVTNIPNDLRSGNVQLRNIRANLYDGDYGRTSREQDFEQIKLVFRRNGTTVGQTAYSPDLRDRVCEDNIQHNYGNLNINGGFDEIVIVHYEDPVFGQGNQDEPNSMFITALCLEWVPPVCNSTISRVDIKNGNNGSTVTQLQNGGTYLLSDLPSRIFFDAVTAGAVGSVQFNYNGDVITENNPPYTYPPTGSTFVPTTGTHTLRVKAFGGGSLSGPVCDEEVITFNIVCEIPRGNVDGICTNVRGWAYDPDDPAQSIQVHIYVRDAGTNALIANEVVTADDPRSDINNAFGIPGNHGFDFDLVPKYCGRNVKIEVFAINIECGNHNPLLTGSGGTCNIPKPSVTLTVDKPEVCEGEGAQLKATVSGGSGFNYSWQYKDVGGSWRNASTDPNSNIWNLTASNLANRTRQWRVVVTNSTGCSTTSNAVTTTVNPNPNVVCYWQINDQWIQTCDISVCVGDKVVLGAHPNTDANTWRWTGPNGFTANTRIATLSNSVTSAEAGTYTVTYTDANGCSGTAQLILTVNPKPVVQCEFRINGSGSWNLDNCNPVVCVGDKLELAANPNNLTYQWSGPNGFSGTGGSGGQVTVSDDITPAHAGVYTVTVTDGNGCSATKQLTVTVNEPPVIVCEFNINNSGWVVNNCDVELCEGEALSLSVNPNGLSYQWSGPNGFNKAGNSNGDVLVSNNITPAQSGTYSVTVTGSNGCSSTKEINVTVNPKPDLQRFISVDGGPLIRRNSVEVCEGSSIVFDLCCEISGWSFRFQRPDGAWFPGGTGGASPDQLRIMSADIGEDDGVWQVEYTDDNGCVNTETFTVIINPIPELDEFVKINDGDFVQSNTVEVCAGDDVFLGLCCPWQDFDYTFTRPDGRDFAGGTNGAERNQIRIPNIGDNSVNEGVWQARYVSRITGCENTASFTVIVNPQPTVRVTISNDPDCTGESTGQIVAFGEGGAGGGPDAYTYSISPNVGTVVNGRSFENLPAGTYTITVVDAKGCSNQTAFTLDDPAPLVISAGNNQSICEGETATLTASASGGTPGYTYQWSNGATTQSITLSPSLSSYANQTFNFTVTVTDANGCTDTDDVSLEVLSNPEVTVSKEDATCQEANGSVTFSYPNNPDRGGIEFSFDGGNTYTEVSEDIGSFTFANLASGTYDLVVRWGNTECPVDLPDVTVGNSPLPTVSANDGEICEGENITLTATPA